MLQSRHHAGRCGWSGLEGAAWKAGAALAIDYLLIGHLTQDVTPAGTMLGGTALYASVTAQRLGQRVGLVTRAPARLEAEIRAALPDVALHILPTEQATTFENRYLGNDRQQFLRHVAEPLSLTDVPEEWRHAPVVHLAPIAQEVDPALAAQLAHSLVCVTPQGWLRAWDESGEVRPVISSAIRQALEAVDVMVFSAEDVGHDPEAMRELISAVPLAVVTQAGEGAVIYREETVRPMPARPAEVVDPTGAGDVFAAAFFTWLRETGNPLEAAAFANAVASFSIEAVGPAGIPAREAVEAWLARRTNEGTPGVETPG